MNEFNLHNNPTEVGDLYYPLTAGEETSAQRRRHRASTRSGNRESGERCE